MMFFSRWRRKAAKSDQVAPKLDLKRVEKVRALLQSADLRQAEEEIGAMEAAWGDSAELGLLRAGLLRRQGRHAEAISICESAVIEAERPALAQFELAESHLPICQPHWMHLAWLYRSSQTSLKPGSDWASCFGASPTTIRRWRLWSGLCHWLLILR
jgi:hypothetical protein